MSRSNGPLGQTGGIQPPFKRTVADQDPANRAYSLGQGAHPAQGSAPSQQPRHAPAAFSSLDPGYPANGYGYDQHGGHGQQTHPNQPAFQQQPGYYPANPSASGQPSYQPVFDRYVPEPQARTPDPTARGYDVRTQQPRTASPQAHPYAPAPTQPAPFNPQDAYRGTAVDQWQQGAQATAAQSHPQRSFAPQPHSPAPHSPATAAPNNYDFSNYAAAPPQDYNDHAYGQPASPALHAYDLRQPHIQQSPSRGDDGQWQRAVAYDRRNELPSDPNAYQDPNDLGADPLAYANDSSGQLQHADDLGYDQDDHPDYEDDEPRRGRRGLIMVSALVGAIALGGGMAYAYKTFIKPSGGSQVAKVSAPKGPAKTAPADPGGKQFPNQESKLQERLGDGTAASSGSAPVGGASNLGETDGVQRVRTMTVGRDGTLSPPTQASAIPGMVVQMPPTQPQAAPSAASLPTPPPAQARIVAPQARAAVAEVAEVTPPEVAASAPLKKPTAQKKPLAARDDLVASNGVPSAATAALPPPVKAGGTGFVAVIASKASKADAQRANVDLEQRFDVLKGKIFDVQEADLTAQGKGVVYRSVVGPPGSRAFASGICEQLKTVGYTDCWPVKYN